MLILNMSFHCGIATKLVKKHVDKQGYFLLCWFIDVFTLKFEDR